MRKVLLLVGGALLLWLLSRVFSTQSSPTVAVVVATPSDGRPVQQKNTLEDGVQSDPLAFSWLTDDVSKGNPISWSGRVNSGIFRPAGNNTCLNLQKQRVESKTCRPRPAEVVLQGHTVPLANEVYASREETPTIVPFARERASPLCCPSSLSTDAGCVCGV
jgi:hypothetical protein